MRIRAILLSRVLLPLASLVLLPAAAAAAIVIDFEDLGAGLPIDGNLFYDGHSAYDPGDPDATDFSSQGASFNNEFTPFTPDCCWQGFAYSQTTDTQTSGPGNQYSAIPGSGAGGSATYGVGFTGGVVGATGVSSVDLGAELAVQGAYLTNTTWAVQSMLFGDAIAKVFGGASGDDPDFLSLTITGYDALGGMTGAVEFLLADYRFTDNSLDYVVTDWTWVDLSSLGAVASLDFTLDSSDTAFGFLNTPAYFAIDDLTLVPEPGTATLLGCGLGALAAARRRRSTPAAARARRAG